MIRKTESLPPSASRGRDWPYLESETDVIAATIGVEGPLRLRMIEHVASAGARFIADKTGEKRPAPAIEIANIVTAINGTIAAIQDASDEAIFFLHTAGGHEQRPLSVSELRQMLERFLAENREALDNPPRASKGGPAILVAERKLIANLRNAFVFARQGAKNFEGWPAFRAACLAPLAARHDLLRRSEKAWDTLLETNSLVRPFERLKKRTQQ